ncbi:MAG: energy transducer TonB [Parafilimonas sp.]|nr:energy transducer TonB [Parafilimonas sp.]
MLKNFKPAFLFLLTFFCCYSSFSQEKKDTIYFDEDWSICEKPVAEYYRVCELNKNKEIFYKGDVVDYFIDGSIEMTGHYSDNGYKDGEFIFYNKKGIILKKGFYINDEMKGDWFYYDITGNIKVVFKCQSSTDFTPIFLVNNNNDTLLKNGNGKFSFDTQKDLPNVFPPAEEYFVEGAVVDSLKEGIYYYNSSQNHQSSAFSESYKNGKFIKGKSYDETIKKPLAFLHLADANLNKVDVFYHSNSVFGFGADGDQKVVNYLLYNYFPEILANATSFYDNGKIIFDIIGNVLRKSLKDTAIKNISYEYPAKLPFYMYYSFITSKPARDIKGNVSITVDTAGRIANFATDASLTQLEINNIKYYLSHVTGLKPYDINGEKTIANINITLNSILTSSEYGTTCLYEIYNSDSVDATSLKNYASTSNFKAQGQDYYKEFTSVQIEAKFPGGSDAWAKYLERNLNAQTPSDHRAPAGNYTVTVSFLVDEEGNVSDVHALNDPGYGTAEEAVRVIKKGPKWVPAIQNGKNVNYRQKQNITFQVVKF